MQASTSRVEIFSDGVMAIIITIMILELKLPELNEKQDAQDIKHHLIELLPHFGAYVFSFVMIGILWTNHHNLFHLLEKTDNFLLGQNLFFLFWMSLIPFVTALIGANPTLPLSTAFYGFIMLMTSLSLTYIRSHTFKNRLVHTDEETEDNKKIEKIFLESKRHSYVASAVYLLSVPLAFVNVYLSYACFIIPVILFLVPAKIEEEGKLADKIIEKNN